ncbi:MAG: hypothetical protein Fur005_46790 [Roseiflexaceae bacterium]
MSDQEGQEPEVGRKRNFRKFQDLIDQLIGNARAQGQFDNLAGNGKPLDVNDDLQVPEDQRLAFRMLKSHGFVPPWMEARQDIELERARIAAWLAETNARWPRMHEATRTAAKVRYKQMLEDLRRAILDHNLTSPTAAGQIEGVNMPLELARLGTASAESMQNVKDSTQRT